MTQARLFPPDEAGPGPLTYLLDTCVPLWLDCINKGPDDKCRYSPDEIASIWHGLEDLARIGRLRLIGQVKDELDDKHKAAKERLCAHPKHRAPNMSRRIRLRYKQVVQDYPGWVRPDWQKDPADPWLVAYAEEFSYSIVTEEIHAAEHRPKWKQRRIYIPDVCERRGVRCVSLLKLAVDERWLPSPR